MSVGGPAASRGIAFQHAEAVVACVQALESADIGFLRVEGVEDIVDFELCRGNGSRVRVCQAKTRQEPYTWAPGEIVSTIARWRELSNADDARFEFLTDGSAGRELANQLQPALRRAQKGTLTEDDRVYLVSKGLDANDPVLARVGIESRQPDADALLDRASLRLLRLIEIGGGDASTERADDLINALFRLVVLRAGNDDPDARLITREELSDVAGIDLVAVDSTRAWDDDAREAYSTRLQAHPPHPSLVMLETRELGRQPSALTLVSRQSAEASTQSQPQPATELLNPEAGAMLSGGPGSGKSTTLELLIPEALDRGLFPVLISVEGYEAGGLWPLVRESVERGVGHRLGPTAVQDVLSGEGAALLIDGAGELPPEARESLLADMQRVQRDYRQLRIIATSRDPARLRALGLASFVLQRLDPAQRRQIAQELLGDSVEPVVREVEERLGDVVANPLLFVMALSLADTGVHADTRAELFVRFVEGLAARPGGDQLSDLVIALLRDACFQLRSSDVYSADTWMWRRLLAAGLTRLAEARMFTAETMSADEALQRAQTGGLLRVFPGSGLVGLIHDLFCDFFAAEAARAEQSELPDLLPESLEETAVFLAERGSLTASQARAIAGNPVAAARCAAAEPPGGARSDEEATQLLALLVDQLGADAADRLAGVRLRVLETDDGTYVFALRPDASDVRRDLDGEQAAEVAQRVVKVARGASSLKAAVAVWLAELRASLADRPEGIVTAIPSEREQLPEALEQAFTAREVEAKALVAEVCPGLAERVTRVLGMRGFHAVVGPTTRSPAPPAGGDIVDHPLTFSFNAADVSVALADAVDRDFVEEPATRTSCESWLRDAPGDAARKDVAAALADLLPGLGP